MAVKIRLKRIGKKRAPFYRIVVMDARTKRDGRAIEEIGKYNPKADPSFIHVESDRAQYWLGVGAQPTEAVVGIFKASGDWQKFKGEAAPPPLKVAEPKRNKQDVFNEALAEAHGDAKTEAVTKKTAAKKTTAKKAAAPSDEASTETSTDAAEALGRVHRGLMAVEAEALEHLVRGIVDHPDDVSVRSRNLRRGRTLEVYVNPEDIGKVIGRGGRTATAIRTVVGALSNDSSVRIDFVDEFNRRGRR